MVPFVFQYYKMTFGIFWSYRVCYPIPPEVKGICSQASYYKEGGLGRGTGSFSRASVVSILVTSKVDDLYYFRKKNPQKITM